MSRLEQQAHVEVFWWKVTSNSRIVSSPQNSPRRGQIPEGDRIGTDFVPCVVRRKRQVRQSFAILQGTDMKHSLCHCDTLWRVLRTVAGACRRPTRRRDQPPGSSTNMSKSK